MSTSLKKTPEIIQHVQRLNKISIKQNLASEHSQIQGTYIIDYDGTDGEEAIIVTESNNELATDKFICLKADNGMLLIEGELESQNCVRNILKVFSPAGFEMGSVRKGMFDLNSPYDICGGNLQVLFYFKYYSSETSIMNQNNEVVATVSHNTEKATFDISYHLETAAIEKILILTGVLMCTKYKQLYDNSLSYCWRLIFRQLILFLILCLMLPFVITIYVCMFLSVLLLLPFPYFAEGAENKKKLIMFLCICPWSMFCVCSYCRNDQADRECGCLNDCFDFI
ncbi:uncharacterized protein LOC127736503 isoform X1 [Mytilus californianus]|uniref:uncharacterized protein LOC127736503 isoform X1 n=3 Tax=Mytilus californianus TaxID=6549 RepID=UPI002246812E|nr:uncharacterized protein LOC127736503 isoform X1 [Mytilus californianus]XP_052103006.1 uncharacterized protein LOC127736503 isoform X1 [Mytilus californianus]